MTPVNDLRFLRRVLLIFACAIAFPAPVAAGESPPPLNIGRVTPLGVPSHDDSLAAGDECRIRASGKEPAVTFALETGPAKWHHDKTRDQIRALRSKSGAKVAAVGPNWQSIGLTLASFILAVDVRVVAQPIGPSRAGGAAAEYCARLIAADVKFGTTRLDAYVTRDYRPGTCPHRVVRDHEDRHVAIYRAGVERFAPLIESRLQTLARELPPVRAANAKAGAERLRKTLHDDLARIFDAMGREIERENQALDTAGAYEAERALCPPGDW